MHTYESIQTGDSFSVRRVVTAEDARAFAEVTGEVTPLQADDESTCAQRFGPPVVQDVLLLGLISKVLGRDFPGHGSVAVGLSCRFLRPVPAGSEIDIEIEISEKIERRKHVKVRVSVYRGGERVLGGAAVVIPPSAADEKARERRSEEMKTL